MKGILVTTAVVAIVSVPAVPAYATRYDAADAVVVNKLQRNGQSFYVPRYHYAGTATSGAALAGYPFADASQERRLSRLPRQLGGSSSAFGWRLLTATTEPIVTLSAGGVSLQANRAAGCSIWGWEWHGKQFINHRDYGREMQVSLSWTDSSHNTPNPTEAGDRYSNASPCTATVSGETLGTTTVPLEWNGGTLRGSQGGPHNPVVWGNMTLGKEMSLNYMNMGPVASYKTEVTIPRALSRGHVEIPTVYLGPEFAQMVPYDAGTGATLPAGGPRDRAVTYEPTSGYGGIIATTPRHDFAMGVYGVATSSGGSVSLFTATYYGGPQGGDQSGTSPATVKLTATYIGPLAAGTNTYTSWVICGTFDGVKRAMSELYRNRASQAMSISRKRGRPPESAALGGRAARPFS